MKKQELKIRGKSNRRYPAKKCSNPECADWFIPTDVRQLYCCEQCGIDARNDKRKESNATRFLDEKTLRDYDKILEKLFYRLEETKRESVTLDELKLFGMEEDDLVVEMVKGKKLNILWFYDFGTTVASQGFPHFQICRRRKYKNGKPTL